MNNAAKKVLIVLGMHRSGTSAVAGELANLGWELPDELMPAHSDNPAGYFESRQVARLNTRVLALAERDWFDSRAIDEQTLLSAQFASLRDEVSAWLTSALLARNTLLLKDPRLCRTFPLWRQALADLGVECRVLLMLRHPAEVARSLQARMLNADTRPAGIPSLARSYRLWMRYVLDAERYSRTVPRVWLTYDQMLAQGQSCLIGKMNQLWGGDIKVPTRESLFDPQLRRQQTASRVAWGAHRDAFELYQWGVTASETDEHAPARWDRFAVHLAQDDDHPSRESIHHLSPEYGHQLCRLQQRRGVFAPESAILFVAEDCQSVGHHYRVVNHVQALRSAGIPAKSVSLQAWQPSMLNGIGLVIVFRPRWHAGMAALYNCAKSRDIPVLADFDDMLFAPEVMRSNAFDYYQRLSDSEQREWDLKITQWQQALQEADGAVVSTQPLAEVARLHTDKPVAVWRNGVNWDMSLSQEGPLAKSENGNKIRIGYASGTPTHQRDFALIVPALVRILENFADTELTLVGHLDLGEFPALQPFIARIEQRPPVPYARLSAELRRFDINLAPLDVTSLFCQGKSELKYFEAALLGIPSVASPTRPFADAIVAGVNGLLAESEMEWYESLSLLVTDATLREAMGKEAFYHAWHRFGPEQQSQEGLALLANQFVSK